MRPVALLLALLVAGHAAAAPPAERVAVLRRGVNLTNWFRFPARTDPAALHDYLPDAAMAELHRAGFSFVRLAVQPEVLLGAGPGFAAALADAIARLQAQHLAVVVELHPHLWHLEQSAADRASLVRAWQTLAPILAPRDPRLTFAEIVNEPVFADDAPGWAALQAELREQIRSLLPATTIVLTGNDWGSLDGLVRLVPAAGGNVIYSFHFYEPVVLTTLAAFEPGLDRTALGRLPFPVTPSCDAVAETTQQPRTRDVIRYYCATPADPATQIARAGAWARRFGAAVMLSEFGAAAALNAPARLAWLAAVRGAAEHEGFGWALWGYEDSMGFGAGSAGGFGAKGPRPALDPAILRALGLPPP
jgi:hypothetical protein